MVQILSCCLYSFTKGFSYMFHSHYKRRYPIDLPLGSCCNESFKSVSEDIEDSSYNSEEEGEITDDEFEQDFERGAYYNSENEGDGMADSNEEVSLESDCTKVSENLQEDTILLSSLQDISQNSFQMEISSFKDGHELQIPVVVSRNLVCVDEFLHFQEDPEKISKFPYSDFPFEHCCNEELESDIEHKKIAFYSSEEEK
jgi:hypothetical protein